MKFKRSILLVSFTIARLFSAENAGLVKFDCSTLHKNLLSCSILPDAAFHIAPYFFTPDSAGLYGKQLQTLALVNKKNGALVSAISKDIKALRIFIKSASDYFPCSNEKITRSLPWKSARQIMLIQNRVWAICHDPSARVCFAGEKDLVASEHMLKRLCQEDGADLDFTYGQESTTPFMALCASPSRCENDDVIRKLKSFFIDKHKKGFVDLKAVDTEGRNGFMISVNKLWTHWVMESFFLCFLFEDQTLKLLKGVKFDIDLININQRDNNGDTALHLYFCGDWTIKNNYIDAFIAAGADPEIKNNKGMTPLQLLEQLEKKDRERFRFVPEYFKQCIEKKKKDISC